MKDLARIESVYIKVDLQLERERSNATTSDAAKIQAEQALNDQAYFVLCWGQLELEVDQICRRAIMARSAHADWQIRRSWYLYNPKDKRLSGLSFEDRAALVMDRDDKSKGSAWAKTMFHYKARNEIAHGRLQATRIDVSAFVQDCSLVQAALHRSA